MMDRTDRHFRRLARALSRHALLYTEMVTTGALLHGDHRRLAFDPAERPLALQLGGDDPAAVAACAGMAEEAGFDEVNLNVGCPSERVQQGRFGACLMREPERVAELVVAARAATRLPVTVKHRIGVDDLDRYEDMARFVEAVAAAGCGVFAVHARKAWLAGLSPRQNRDVPPLRYDDVYRLKADFPHLHVTLNGGVRDLAAVRVHLERVDGVMLGRAAYDDPYLLASADGAIFDVAAAARPSRWEVAEGYLAYAEEQLAEGEPLARVVRHLGGLYRGCRGGRRWRRVLTEQSLPGAGMTPLRQALRQLAAEAR